MIRVKLRYVHECSFVRGEHTNFDLWQAERARRKWPELKDGDAVALIAKQRNQIAFVYKPVTVAIREHEARLTVSTRVRLHSRSQLNPATLALAATNAGLELVGFKHFEQYFANLI